MGNYRIWLSRFGSKKEDEPSKEYTLQAKNTYICKSWLMGQVLFVVVRFIYWLSEIKRSENARLQSISKPDKDPGFEPEEESWNCYFKLDPVHFDLMLLRGLFPRNHNPFI